MSNEDPYTAVVPDYRDGKLSLLTSNGRVIVGTQDELRAALPERMAQTLVRVPRGGLPTLAVRDWLLEGPNEDESSAAKRLEKFDAAVKEMQAHPIRVIESAEIENLTVTKHELVEHARRELALRGETDQAFVDSIIAAVRGFCSYPGHSGGSMAIAVEYVHDLLRFRALAPLTNDPAEWTDQSEISGRPLWQNNRDSRAMSEDGGRTYWLVDEQSQTSDGPDAPKYIAAEPFTPR
jgi:hypothetical protein